MTISKSTNQLGQGQIQCRLTHRDHNNAYVQTLLIIISLYQWCDSNNLFSYVCTVKPLIHVLILMYRLQITIYDH
uniref:Uncharacterized protein n=1 Tax=Arundo donax TaxID=35708 RepID=A0A0A9HMD8_ARUDO